MIVPVVSVPLESNYVEFELGFLRRQWRGRVRFCIMPQNEYRSSVHWKRDFQFVKKKKILRKGQTLKLHQFQKHW